VDADKIANLAQHPKSLGTAAIDNLVIMLIFLIYSLVLCWENISHSNATMKFAQLHYFLPQNIGGNKRYYVPQTPSLNFKLGPLWQC